MALSGALRCECGRVDFHIGKEPETYERKTLETKYSHFGFLADRSWH